MDLEGKIHRKGTVPCELPRLMELLGPYAGDVTVGVESTYNWYWLIDALHRVEVPYVLGHALYMSRKMSGKHKSDGVDAQGIADLLRTNQFPLAYSYPPEMRGVRDLLRRRHTFVRRRAGTLTHFQCSLHHPIEISFAAALLLFSFPPLRMVCPSRIALDLLITKGDN